MAALELFIIGAPGSGKSSVFNALTVTPEGPRFTTKEQHRLGTVKVPDNRLEVLTDMYKPRKVTPAEITFADVAAPASADGTRRFSQATAFLSQADAFALVVQGFGETDYQGRSLNAVKEMESVLLELIVEDMEKLERRLEKIGKERNRGLKTTSDQEIALLEKLKEALEQDQSLRQVKLREDEEKLIRGYQLLSMKPILSVINTSEKGLADDQRNAVRQYVKEQGMECIEFCAVLEEEIAQLPTEDQKAFLRDYQLEEPARIRLIQAAYRLLGLVSFFTVGEDEVKAWTILEGTTAQSAAGKIHSDIERGFIRAETVLFDDLIRAGSWAASRDQALLRLEGKDYTVQDGDIINFRFNV